MNSILQQLQQHAAALSPPLQAELLNYAIYLEQKVQGEPSAATTRNNQKRQRLAEALAQAAILNPYGDIDNPVAWQREQRQDRPLPRRNHAD